MLFPWYQFGVSILFIGITECRFPPSPFKSSKSTHILSSRFQGWWATIAHELEFLGSCLLINHVFGKRHHVCDIVFLHAEKYSVRDLFFLFPPPEARNQWGKDSPHRQIPITSNVGRCRNKGLPSYSLLTSVVAA